MKPSIGESMITPDIQQQVTPELVSPEGQQQVKQKLGSAIQQKGMLDFIFEGIAKKIGAEFSSRTKNPETVIQKIGQKRIQGRNYNLNDLTDIYGGRFVITNPEDKPKIENMLNKAQALNIFKINKKENVKNDTYRALHFDIETPSGMKGEIQIHSPQSALESVANHSLRAVHGEKPPEQVQALRDMQAKLAHKTPHGEAIQKAQAIQQTSQQINGKPLDPRIVASILAQK